MSLPSMRHLPTNHPSSAAPACLCWRAERVPGVYADTMNRVAAVLGVTIHVDLTLLSFECTCIEGGHCFNEVVSLPTTGVNTHRIWMMESFLKEIKTYGRRFTVHEYHEMLKTVESSKPDYAPWQQGLAAACACGAFVLFTWWRSIEMACAFVGAGVGNFPVLISSSRASASSAR